MTSIPSNGRTAGILCGLGAALIWGGFPVMTRFGVAYSSLDYLDITFLRFAVSGMLLAPWLMRKGLGKMGARPVTLMVVGIGAPYMLVVSSGLSRAPVGLFAVITPASMIGFSVLLSAIALGHRLPQGERIGLSVIGIGIALAGYFELKSTTGGGSLSLFLFGGFLWAIYTVSTKAFSVGALHATAIVSVVSGLIYSPIYLAVRGITLADAPALELLLQALYQGVLVSIVALYLYSKSVELLGPTIGACFAALVPVFAVIEASVMLGEAPPSSSIMALALVSMGMMISLRSKETAAL